VSGSGYIYPLGLPPQRWVWNEASAHQTRRLDITPLVPLDFLLPSAALRKSPAAMRFVSALLAVASVVSTVKGYWLGDIPRENYLQDLGF